MDVWLVFLITSFGTAFTILLLGKLDIIDKIRHIKGIYALNQANKSKGSQNLPGTTSCLCGNGCIGIVELTKPKCLLTKNLYNELRVLIKSRKIYGILSLLRPTEASKALRKIETRLIELKIQLERRPDNYLIKRQIDVLEKIASLIKIGHPPISLRIIILFRAENTFECKSLLRELENIFDQYNCRPKRILPSKLLGQLFREPKEIVSDDAVFELIELVNEADLTSNGEYVVPLGRELQGGAIFSLPLWDKGALHVLVIGPTGKGKTTLLATLINRVFALYKDVKIAAFDPKGDLSLLVDIPERFTITADIVGYLISEAFRKRLLPLTVIAEIVGLSREEHIIALASLLRRGCGKNLVANTSTMLVVEKLKAYGIRLDVCTRNVEERVERLINSLSDTSVIVDLSPLSDPLRDIVLWALLSSLSESIEKTSAKKLRRIIVVDEAWRLRKAPLSLLQKMFKEGRSYGVSVILATQDPEDVIEEIWNNTSIVIIFGSSDKEYIEKLGRILSLHDNEFSKKITYLGRGEVIVKLPGSKNTPLVYVDPETSIVFPYMKGNERISLHS